MEIRAVRLVAGDLAAQRGFYAERLGLPLLDEAPASFTVAAGGTRLTFEAAPRGAVIYHLAFNIPENKLAVAKAWLAGRASLLTRGGADEFTFRSWNADAAYFLDPDGNILECIARHNLPNAAPGPFGPEDLLEVSEIGMPVDDVPATVALLATELGLTPYGEQSAAFAAVGDERGLFIVVARGRPWFTTDRPAEVAPFALTLLGASERRWRVPGQPYDITVVAP